LKHSTSHFNRGGETNLAFQWRRRNRWSGKNEAGGKWIFHDFFATRPQAAETLLDQALREA
jgi:hypothetical protein